MTEDPRAHAPATRVDLLLIDDSADDVDLVREALAQVGWGISLATAADGVAGLRMLRGEGGAPPLRPALIVLDINLPGRGGWSILSELKQDSELRVIPVVMLSTSAVREDILRAYDLHASCYLVKPFEFAMLADTLETLCRFWFGTATVPHPPSGLGVEFLRK